MTNKKSEKARSPTVPQQDEIDVSIDGSTGDIIIRQIDPMTGDYQFIWIDPANAEKVINALRAMVKP